jgi:hypothetical protein
MPIRRTSAPTAPQPIRGTTCSRANNYGTVILVREGTSPARSYCREFQQIVSIGKTESAWHRLPPARRHLEGGRQLMPL